MNKNKSWRHQWTAWCIALYLVVIVCAQSCMDAVCDWQATINGRLLTTQHLATMDMSSRNY